jgi:hypothetical protein
MELSISADNAFYEIYRRAYRYYVERSIDNDPFEWALNSHLQGNEDFYRSIPVDIEESSESDVDPYTDDDLYEDN